MSSITSGQSTKPACQYISTVPFNNDIFSYTLHTDLITYVKTGVLSATITGATESACPAGCILRETGQKLYPGIHPNITTYMIGVTNPITGLTGYIDPHSPVYELSTDTTSIVYLNHVDPSENAPVCTNGVVCAKGQIRCVGAAGQRVQLDGSAANIHVDVSKGSFVYITSEGTHDNTITCGNYQFGDRLFIQTDGLGDLTFSTGFGVATVTVPKPAMMFTFICDGSYMLQQSASSWANVFP